MLTGFLSGIVATIVMTLTEIPSWKKWGLHGVFEWHENQILSSRFLNIQNSNKVHFKAVFSLHFLNGALAGIAYPFIISLFEFLNIGSVPCIFARDILWFCIMDAHSCTYTQTYNWTFSMESPFRSSSCICEPWRTHSLWFYFGNYVYNNYTWLIH